MGVEVQAPPTWSALIREVAKGLFTDLRGKSHGFSTWGEDGLRGGLLYSDESGHEDSRLSLCQCGWEQCHGFFYGVLLD